MIDTLEFYNELTTRGFSFFSGVPDSLLKELCACITEKTPPSHNIIASNEGSAISMCAGYHMSTGKYGISYMQNSGEGNIINPLLSLVDPEVYSIPVLLIIGWRGEPGIHDEPQHVKQGKVTLDLLETMGVEYEILNDDFKNSLDKATAVLKESRPFALIVRKNTFSKYTFKTEYPKYPLKREDALEIIVSNVSKDDILVSSTGKSSRELFEIRERNGEGHENDFLTVGSMGHTCSIAYGIALGTDKTVYCIDGDGSFIMHMGSVATIGAKPLPNLKYIINDNGSHESVGNQPTCSNALDIPTILKGFGFDKILIANDEDELRNSMPKLASPGMVAMVIKTTPGSRDDLGRPTTTPIENKKSLMRKLGACKE